MHLPCNTRYSNSSLLVKILAWATLVASGFVLFHLVMMELGFFPKPWVMETYSTLQNGLPFFLFLTGAFIRDKRFRIPLVLFFGAFFIAYVLNELDFYEVIDIQGLKWAMGIPLTGLLVTYLVFFFSKQEKTVLDFLKLAWFVCISYAFLSARFPIGFHSILFFEASVFIFLVMMALGLYRFFRKPSL